MMSRPPKIPPPPRLPATAPAARKAPAESKRAARSPAKPPAARTPAPPGATVESVAARLLTLPQTEGATPALWQQADFGRELSRAEKPFLDAALARLQAERRLVALSYGKRVYFAFAGPLGERLGTAPAAVNHPADEPAVADDLLDIYRRLVRESGGFPDVKISLLARGVGPMAARGLAERLKTLWRTGDATLSLGDWSLASEETRAAAVEMDGERYLLVRFDGA